MIYKLAAPVSALGFPTQGLVSPQLINLPRTRRRQAHLRANVANFCSLFSRPCRCIPGGLIHASICMWGRRAHAAARRCGSTVQYLHMIEKLRLCSYRDLNNAKGTQLNSNKLSQVSQVLNKGNAKYFL